MPEDAWITPRECVFLIIKAQTDSSEYAEAFLTYLRETLREVECQPTLRTAHGLGAAHVRVVGWLASRLFPGLRRHPFSSTSMPSE